jgi:hypothetical protein
VPLRLLREDLRNNSTRLRVNSHGPAGPRVSPEPVEEGQAEVPPYTRVEVGCAVVHVGFWKLGLPNDRAVFATPDNIRTAHRALVKEYDSVTAPGNTQCVTHPRWTAHVFRYPGRAEPCWIRTLSNYPSSNGREKLRSASKSGLDGPNSCDRAAAWVIMAGVFGPVGLGKHILGL